MIDEPIKKDRPTHVRSKKLSKIKARIDLSNFLEQEQKTCAKFYAEKHPKRVAVEHAVRCSDTLFASLDS
jgi:hypothetical protein